MKGIELDTGKRMSEVIAEVAGWPPEQVAVVTGPNLAHEIAQRQYAATVVACTDQQTAENLQKACHTGYFRPYTNPDVIGCELGGTVKNPIAIAVGIAVGMGLGDNTRAMLITRGLAETARLGDGPRRRPAHVRGTRRNGRPGRHLLIAAFPQPDLRRETGPRDTARRHYRQHKPGG